MSAVSKVANKLKFVTAAVPTQADFSDLIDSSPNIVDDNIVTGSNQIVVGVIPAAQGTATVITAAINKIQPATPMNAGLKMQPAKAGMKISIFNSSIFSQFLYPHENEQIAGAVVNASIEVLPNQIHNLLCTVDGVWIDEMSIPHNSNNSLEDYEVGITAVTPPNQVTGYQLTKRDNVISDVNIAGAGVVLPLALPGREISGYNTSLNNLTVYATGVEIIGNGVGSTTMTIISNTAFSYKCIQTGRWSIMPAA